MKTFIFAIIVCFFVGNAYAGCPGGVCSKKVVNMPKYDLVVKENTKVFSNSNKTVVKSRRNRR